MTIKTNDTYLLHPGSALFVSLATDQIILLAHLAYLLLEALHLGPRVAHIGEDIAEQREEQVVAIAVAATEAVITAAIATAGETGMGGLEQLFMD